MKTQIIKIISAVVLLTASVNVFGQNSNTQGQTTKSQIIDISNLTTEQKQALYGQTLREIGVLEVENRSLRGQKSVNNGNFENGKCQAETGFHGNNCNEIGQEKGQGDSQISDAQKKQIKTELNAFFSAVSKYNDVVKDYNTAHSNNDSRRNELASQVGSAAKKARSIAGNIIDNAAVNPSVISKVKEIDNSLLEYNSDGTLQPASDLESLRQFIDCDDCFLKK